MPELPEVETIRRQLAPLLVGKQMKTVTVYRPKSFTGDIALVESQQILKVWRRSKMLFFELSNQHTLALHLKMSGQVLFVDGEHRHGGGHPTADWVQHLPSKHTRVSLHFSDGTTLFFNDQRMFGWMKLLPTAEISSLFAKLGPDISDTQIQFEAFFHRLSRHTITIKQLILSNTLVAGVGNIYVCDALHLAKIHPLRQAKSLSKTEAATLLTSMQTVIALGIQRGGATAHGAYVHVSGLAGSYQEVMRVYNQAGKPCQVCGTEIQKRSIAGRGTYFCPTCQKAPDVSLTH